MSIRERIFGLDLARAGAISLVVIAHSLIRFADRFPWLTKIHLWMGSLGVDLFFALSGYLVGGILLRDLAEAPNGRSLLKFYGRRWFRTLPNYYLFLFLNTLVFYLFFGRVTALHRYLFFGQNLFTISPSPLFSPSWSLAVEEWFYVTLPLVFWGSWLITRRKKESVLMAIGLLAFASFGLRSWAAHRLPYPWDEIRKVVVFRFDALMAGVLGAYLNAFHSVAWESKQRLAFWIGVAGLGLYTIFFFQLDLNRSYFAKTTLLLFGSLCLLCLLPFLGGWKRCEYSVAAPIRKLSEWSYSLYLAHPLIHFLLLVLAGVYWAEELTHRALIVTLSVVVSLGVAALTYRCFELPATQLRERFG